MDLRLELGYRPRVPLGSVNHNNVSVVFLLLIDLDGCQVKERVAVWMEQKISADIEPTLQARLYGGNLVDRTLLHALTLSLGVHLSYRLAVPRPRVAERD